jgi:hypothetical protein
MTRLAPRRRPSAATASVLLSTALLAACQAAPVAPSRPPVSMPSQGAPLQPAASVGAALEDLRKRTSPAQFAQVSRAVQASPELVRLLDQLAGEGKFRGFRISAQKKMGYLSAYTEGGAIVFAPEFLPAMARLKFDALPAGAVPPNNLTYIIGHLASHLSTPEPDAKGLDMKQFMQASRDREVLADLQGWNLVIDAALAEKGGQPLTPDQIVSLVAGLHYAELFVKALDGGQVEQASSGRIEPTPRNLEALGRVLGQMRLRDFE